jgi:nickel-dependent lactate racemase
MESRETMQGGSFHRKQERTMRVGLLCGQKTVDLELPDSVLLLEMKKAKALEDPTGAVRKALAHPIQCPPLKDIASRKKNACIVISDITRPVPNRILLPLLLETLHQAGIKKENITILIATGMHRPNLGQELEGMIGRDVVEQYRIVNHYCRNPEVYRKIDEIDGAPIEINKDYLDSELKILTGLIEPHFYAGYSGGRKAILPGISSFETMKFMHSFKMIDHPKVTNCALDGNPFHEYVNVVINKDRQIAGAFAGHFKQAHLAGCDMVYEQSVVPLKEQVDMVVTSGGGYPLDATFYQISKALICAKNILKKGGTILVTCECREGLGSKEFCGIMRSACSPQKFFEEYCDPESFVIDQWCAQNIYQVLDYAGKVYVYSPGLSYEDIMKMGAIKIEDAQRTLNGLLLDHTKVAVSPDGPYVVGMVR